MKRPAITVKYVLMADDVRAEANGKQIVIGLYNDTIILLDGGDTFISPLTFLINAKLPSGKGVPMVTWIEGPAGQRMQESDFGIVVADSADFGALITWKIIPFQSQGLGQYKLHMTQDGQDAIIYEFAIRN
jgi:hypothetical protein